MKLVLHDSEACRVTGELSVETNAEHERLLEVVSQQPFAFSGDPAFVARRLKELQAKREELLARNDSYLNDVLRRTDADIDRLLAASEAGQLPDGAGDWDEERVAAELARRKAKVLELIGEDLPAAHTSLQTKLNSKVSGAQFSRYALELSDDELLAIAELGKAWLARRVARAGKRQSDSQGDPATSGGSGDVQPIDDGMREFLRELGVEVVRKIEASATRIRIKKLEKVRTRTRSKSRGRR